jgi:hypothetical protein
VAQKEVNKLNDVYACLNFDSNLLI